MDKECETAVEFSDVSFRFGTGKAVLCQINLEVCSGETLVFLGRSGSGKTTLLKLVNRLLEPTQGEILVQGIPTTRWDPIRLRRRMGYVIQEVGLFPHLTVADNVALVPRLEGWDSERVDARVSELLALVGLDVDSVAKRYPHELSGGQRQRVGVARALAADPPLMLLDEPFGALDPITRAEIQKEFQELQRKLQKTMVFVTHDVREAFLLGSRIGIMKEGKVVFLGTAGDLMRSDDPETRAFTDSLRSENGLLRYP